MLDYLNAKWLGVGSLPVIATLPASTDVSLTGPTASLDLGDAERSLASLAGVAGSQVITNTSLAVGSSNADTTFDGILSGAGHLTKQGDGTLFLTGMNTRTGNTTVTAGTLSLAANGTLADASVVTLPNTAASGSPMRGLIGSAHSSSTASPSRMESTNLAPAHCKSAFPPPFRSGHSPRDSMDQAKENGPGDDPDNDGLDNLGEFAFNGNPLNGADKGGIFHKIADSNDAGTEAELILTIAVRVGIPAFSGSPSPSASVDGVTYRIQGSTDLTGFGAWVSPVDPVPRRIATGGDRL